MTSVRLHWELNSLNVKTVIRPNTSISDIKMILVRRALKDFFTYKLTGNLWVQVHHVTLEPHG